MPATNVVLAPEVMTGAASTVRVKFWLALGFTPLSAVMVIGKVPWVVGVPLRVAVPSPLSLKLTPLGRGPDSETAAVGSPVVVTVKEPADPSWKVVLATEVIDGANAVVATFSVKD